MSTERFYDWIEISGREATCDRIKPCGMHVAANGGVHLLWHEEALEERLRVELYPDARQSVSLNHAVIGQGQIAAQTATVQWHEGNPSPEPHGRRQFHITSDSTPLVVYCVEGAGPEGENRLMARSPRGALETPIPWFYTAIPRAARVPVDGLAPFGQVDQAKRDAQERVK